MKKNDINNKPFDEATKLKLDIFRKCFREWFPVFFYHKSIKYVFVYDMFAGSGHDSDGNFGSPLILLEEAKGEQNKYCQKLKNLSKNIVFGFNEKDLKKKKTLDDSIKSYFAKCKEHCLLDRCIYEQNVFSKSKSFDDFKNNKRFMSILENPNYAKFVLLDQYGFSHITDEVFMKLVNSPMTDFIFFISSSFVRRFYKHPYVTKYLDTTKMNFDEKSPKECHRIIAEYFRNLIKDKEYYIHHFTIHKGANYYGLIFGTNHSLGMEKFLKVCWSEDINSGESNCNINNDFEKGTLFYKEGESSKKNRVKEEITNLIISGVLTNNIEGLKWTLSRGCEPKLFVDTILGLIKNKRVAIEGKFNRKSCNIHKIDEYKIVVL